MRAEEKAESLRRIIRTTSTRDTERLGEIVDSINAEMIKNPTPKAKSHSNSFPLLEEGCTCVDCPHRQELEKIDEFYKEFLAVGGTFVTSMPGY